MVGLVFGFLVPPAWSQQSSRTVGRVTITVDEGSAFPGGMLTVWLRSRRALGGVIYGILDGRRCPAFATPRGMRVLVPIPVTHPSGRATLGVEIRTWKGRQRIPVGVVIKERAYPPRSTVIPEIKRAALAAPAGVRDGRLLQMFLRTVTPGQQWRAAFQPPVPSEPSSSFGCPQTYLGASPVEMKIDAIHGEYHRGLDYSVEAGTPVKAPAAGTVLFAGLLTLSGQTLVLDHGHGLLSVFYHLARPEVATGDQVPAGAVLGVSGDSGIAETPHLHWGTYVHGVAVDPRVTSRLE
jgi:murein DD-endopeptidase MepM/ murein hydrolase activator NlpD